MRIISSYLLVVAVWRVYAYVFWSIAVNIIYAIPRLCIKTCVYWFTSSLQDHNMNDNDNNFPSFVSLNRITTISICLRRNNIYTSWILEVKYQFVVLIMCQLWPEIKIHKIMGCCSVTAHNSIIMHMLRYYTDTS